METADLVLSRGKKYTHQKYTATNIGYYIYIISSVQSLILVVTMRLRDNTIYFGGQKKGIPGNVGEAGGKVGKVEHFMHN